MNINGITRKLSKDGEKVFYFSKETLLNNILFVEENLYDEEEELKVRLFMVYIDDFDAQFYGLYEGTYLETIQTYGMVKNVVEIYNNSKLNDFLETVRELCTTFMSSETQTRDENKEQIREWLISYYVDYLIK